MHGAARLTFLLVLPNVFSTCRRARSSALQPQIVAARDTGDPHDESSLECVHGTTAVRPRDTPVPCGDLVLNIPALGASEDVLITS